MPRQHRFFVPGHLWHLTHRCHQKEFLFKEKSTRKKWLYYLNKAKQRYGFIVLGYSVTMNHIHLITMATQYKHIIPLSMQYTQGRLAQWFNNSTNRINSFWGNRYHATAIESGSHLLRCLAYVDLNMNRAGAVSHPSQWDECSYSDITARTRFRLVDLHKLALLLGYTDSDSLKRGYIKTINQMIEQDELSQDKRWSESIAVGSAHYVQNFAHALGISTTEKRIHEDDASSTLMETRATYGDEIFSLIDDDNTIPFIMPF
jgi:putative transposase